MKTWTLLCFVVGSLSLTACQSMIDKATKEAKYSAYEMVGVEKRDLFKKEVKKVQSSQEDTSEAFKDALEKLQKIYSKNGSKKSSRFLLRTCAVKAQTPYARHDNGIMNSTRR